MKQPQATITLAGLALSLLLPMAGTAIAQQEAQPAAAPVPAPSSLALRKRAVGLMNAGKFAQAMAVLKGGQTEFPADQDVRFLIGQCALETSQPAEAAAQFEAMLAAEPQLLRVRLDLARAYTMQQDFVRAREQFAIVMASNPPPQVGDNVQKFLAMMDARKSWQARLSAALVSDSNVNTGPGSNSVLSGPVTGVGVTGRSDSALNLVAAFNHVHAMDADMAWQSEANVNLLDYFKEDDSDLLMFSLSTGPSWRQGKFTYSFPVVYDNIRVGGDAYNQSIGIAPQLRYEYAEDLQFTGGFTRAWREHDPLAAQLRDGESLGIFAGARVDLGEHGVLQPTLRLTQDQTDAAYYDNRGVALSLGYSLPLPQGMGLFLQPSITHVRYDAPDPFLAGTCTGCSSTRQDRQYQFTANLSKTYGKNGLGAALGYTYTRNDSNVGLNDYTRHMLTLMATWVF